jgi:hypothetical protein
MSTRSYIAIENPTTKEILATYVHSDGYPDGVGYCLIKHYNSFDKAIKLFNYDQASYIGSTLDDCCFYHRDMGRELEPTENYKEEWFLMNSLKGDNWIEYIYLFKDNQDDSKRTGILIPIQNDMQPSPEWIKIDGMKFKNLTGIGYDHASGENEILTAEFTCDSIRLSLGAAAF